MATTFPTAIDTFTNPTATSLLTAPSHSGLHTDINGAVIALETKVGTGNTVIGTYTAYTPTLTNVTLGNGTVVGEYALVNNFAHVYGSFTFGSTSAITGSLSISLPINISAGMSITAMSYGSILILDTSAAVRYVGGTRYNVSSGSVFAGSLNSAATDASLTIITASTPMTWAVGDVLTWNLYYKTV